MQRTCQDKSDESKWRVARQTDDARKEHVANERLNVLKSYRPFFMPMMRSTDHYNLLTTF